MPKQLWTPNDPVKVAQGDAREAHAARDAEAEETKTLQRQVGELMSWVAAMAIGGARGELQASITDRQIRVVIPNPKALGIQMKGWKMRTKVHANRVEIELMPQTQADMQSEIQDALADGENVW